VAAYEEQASVKAGGLRLCFFFRDLQSVWNSCTIEPCHTMEQMNEPIELPWRIILLVWTACRPGTLPLRGFVWFIRLSEHSDDHSKSIVTDLSKVSTERAPDLSSQIVRIIKVIDSVWIRGIGWVVGLRVPVNWGTCDLH
jgi:hypothetical protein